MQQQHLALVGAALLLCAAAPPDTFQQEKAEPCQDAAGAHPSSRLTETCEADGSVRAEYTPLATS
jgi:hypothetical protein